MASGFTVSPIKLNIDQLLLKPIKPIVKIDELQARRVLAVVDQGLSYGVGDPIPGQMCVEAAVSYAFGEAHSDGPKCVVADVRSFKIDLNDELPYDNNKHRGRELRRIAIAQLGSKKLKFGVFTKHFVARAVQHLYIPHVLKALKAYSKHDLPTTEVMSLILAVRDAVDVKVISKLTLKLSRAVDEWEANAKNYNDDIAELLSTLSTYSWSLEIEDLRNLFDELEMKPIQIAEFGVDVLHELGVPGTEYLWLAPLPKKVKKFWTTNTGYGSTTPTA